MSEYLSYDERFFVANKCCICVDGKILVISERTRNSPLWDLPGWKIAKSDRDLDIAASLERELQEELGDTFWCRNATLFDVRKIYEKAHYGDEILPFVFLFYFIRLESVPEIALSDEHTEYKWINASEINTIWPWREQFDKIIQKAFEINL